MSFPIMQVSSSPLRVVVGVVLAATLGIAAANYFFFSRTESAIWQLERLSGGWINANLPMFVVLSAMIVGGLVLGWGRHRFSDLGLEKGWVGRLLAYVGAGWLLLQLVAVLAVLLTGGTIALNPIWSVHGPATVIGFLFAMVFGTAFFEDSIFRGYLLPQLYLRLGSVFPGHGARTVAAVGCCATIFSLWHLPTILLNREVSTAAVAGALLYMALGGIMLSLLFLRTGRLSVVIACHALVNAPTLLVSAPVSGASLAGLVGVAAIIAGPLLVGQRWSPGLVRPTEAGVGR